MSSIRTFRLIHAIPYGCGSEGVDLYAEDWPELQTLLRGYCVDGEALTLENIWIRPSPITKGDWTIEEVPTPPDYKKRWAI